MQTKSLSTEIEHYSKWRKSLKSTLEELSQFLKKMNVTDLRSHHQFESILGALADDRLSIAFVAEFSRGKSEMINTIFFGDYAQRVLPSGIGRTTMCPVELSYDPNLPTSIRLLPVETRKQQQPLHELKFDTGAWKEIPFSEDDVKAMSTAFKHLTDSKLVSKPYAERLNFTLVQGQNEEFGLPVNEYDEVEIPSWRHAIINLPHPLLEQGLVILDTPGLNAIGAEPELTINQIASAHTAIFILAADTGVSKSDLDLWRMHLKDNNHQNCLVALNKIDSLWDGMRKDEEIDSEIQTQVRNTALTLELPEENIFPVSAQKGLIGKARSDKEILERSRILVLENAIANKLIPEKRKIVAHRVKAQLKDILDTAQNTFLSRCKDAEEHIAELKQLSDNNIDVITHIMNKAQSEKETLETDMNRYQALRAVYNKESDKLMRCLGTERLERLIALTKHDMSSCASSITLQRSIRKFFSKANLYLEQAIAQATEIAYLSEKITQDFEGDNGISNYKIRRLRLEKYQQEIARLERKHQHLNNTKTLFFKEQMSIAKQFYESVCVETRGTFKRALSNATDWKNNLMIPMETHVREHHTMLRRRLESVKRIHKATDTVEQRLVELEASQQHLQQQTQLFERFEQNINTMLAELNENKTTDENSKVIYLDGKRVSLSLAP